MPTPEVEAAWNQAELYSGRLFDALDALDDAGGPSASARSWGTARLERVLASLEGTAAALSEALDELQALQSGRERHRRSGLVTAGRPPVMRHGLRITAKIRT